ncbi:NEP1-interacting protein 1-like [Wolffia australiana]
MASAPAIDASAASSTQASGSRSTVGSSARSNFPATGVVERGDWAFGGRVGRGREPRRHGSRAWKIVGRLICGLLTCVFAIVGSLVGSVVGALIGLATESGILRGAGVGAISGAVFCIDAVESTRAIWQTRGMWSLLFLIDIVVSLLSGRLVREKVDPAVQNAVQSQMRAVNSPFHELPDIFETGGATGMSRASVEDIPKMAVTKKNCVDSAGDKISCSVCLHDLLPGEVVRSLPACGHLFHVPCIDGWLLRHGSCPLCRRDCHSPRDSPSPQTVRAV